MEKKNKTYKLTAKLWIYPGETANWHFLTIPKEVSTEIRALHAKNARGFGSLPVEVAIGKTIWNTSVFPDTRSGTYVLPIKAAVRKKEDIYADESVTFSIVIR